MPSEMTHCLIAQSKRALQASRTRTRLARERIRLSRELLSQSGDRVVLSASVISAARWSAR